MGAPARHPDLDMDLDHLIRTVPDFPKPGIGFRDITPLLAHAHALEEAIDRMTTLFRASHVESVVAIESRGFLFGAPLAIRLGAGLVPCRKPGKLPAATRSRAYELEYGTATLEIHEDALEAGARVLICDDVLATGGTLEAAIGLVGDLGATVVGCATLIELEGLEGRARLRGTRVESLLQMPA
jgi:adenine phosphoribosyltransferase